MSLRESIDAHVLDDKLHVKSSVDGTVLIFSTPTLTTTEALGEEVDNHLTDKSIHLACVIDGTTLVLATDLGDNIISHVDDATCHLAVTIEDGELAFKEQAAEQVSLVDLEKYVPQFIREMGEMHEIYKSQGREIAREWFKVEDVEEQMFPDYADWSISLWETNYGLPHNKSQGLATRRKAVVARLTVPATTTLALVQKTAEEMIGGTIWVEEEPEKSHINIWLMDRENFEATWSNVSQKTWRNYTPHTWMQVITDTNEKAIDRDAFLDWLDTYKPAHLGYTLDYFVMRWKDCLEYTWRDLTDYTWLGVLMGLKEFVTTWKLAQETAGTWSGLNSGYTWYTTNHIKENS